MARRITNSVLPSEIIRCPRCRGRGEVWNPWWFLIKTTCELCWGAKRLEVIPYETTPDGA